MQQGAVLAGLLEATADAVVVVNDRHEIVVFNHGAEKLFGHPQQKMLGCTLDSILPLETVDRHAALIDRFANDETNTMVMNERRPIHGRHRDGHEFPIDVTISKFVVDGNRYFAAIARTRQPYDEVALEAEERFYSVFEQSPDAICVFDLDHHSYDMVNSRALELFDMDRAELLNCNPARLTPKFQPDGTLSGEAIKEHQRRAMNGEALIFEWTHCSKNGAPIPCEVRLTRVPIPGRRLLCGHITDISARKQTERQLKLKERAIASSQNGIGFLSLGGIITEVNAAFTKMWGATCQEEIIGKPLAELIKNGRFFTEMLESLRVHGMWLGEVSAERLDGTAFDLQVSVHEIRSESGETEGYMTALVDVTDRNEIERKLRESEARFRVYWEHAPHGMFVRTTDGWIKDVNPMGCALTGYTREELTQMQPPELLAPGSDQFIETRNRELGAGRSHESDVPIVRKDGSQCWLHVNVAPLGNGDVIGFSMDVTEARAKEQALVASERRLSLALQATSNAVSEVNVQTQEVYFSPRWYEILGYAPYSFKASLESWNALVHPDDRDTLVQEFESGIAANNGIPISSQYRALHKDGTYRWLWTRGDVVEWDVEGKPLLVSGITTDVTDRKMAEENIKTMNLELERRVAERTAELAASNRELEAFSYSVSHDLRGPLRRIHGFASLVLMDYADNLDNTAKQYLERACAATENMGEIIDGLLRLSRFTRGEVVRKRINLSDIARNILSDLQEHDPQRAVETSVENDLTAEADPILLYAVMENLLSNAWKFTALREPAIISVGLDRSSDSRVFFVKDNGAGFDMAYASRLFTAFHRLHTEAEFEGTGIGLATVQRVITRHGGRVWVESAPDHGSTFFFTLG